MNTVKQKKAIEAGWLSQVPYFRKIGRSYGLSGPEIDDLCQDIAIRCLRSIEKVDWTKPQNMRDALIRKIARWQLKDHCRNSARHQAKLDSHFDLHEFAAKTNDPATDIENAEESSHLLAKVEQLDSRASAVLFERYFAGRSDSDIAVLNHEPVDTIRTRRKRALKKLANIIE